MSDPADPPKPTITVAGVTFSADQVKSAVVTIEGRDIYIQEVEQPKQIGFPTQPTQKAK